MNFIILTMLDTGENIFINFSNVQAIIPIGTNTRICFSATDNIDVKEKPSEILGKL